MKNVLSCRSQLIQGEESSQKRSSQAAGFMGRLLDWKRLVTNLDWNLQGAGCTSSIENTSPNAVGQSSCSIRYFQEILF